jgi:hypothetical protein
VKPAANTKLIRQPMRSPQSNILSTRYAGVLSSLEKLKKVT